MSSPVFPLKGNVSYDRKKQEPVYLQLSHQVIKFIRSGKLQPGVKLPGSRTLANELNLHRKTIIAVYTELQAQGWIETIVNKGTFVTKQLPVVQPVSFKQPIHQKNNSEYASFDFLKNDLLYQKPEVLDKKINLIADGVPDHRLVPIDEISKVYRDVMKRSYNRHLLKYNSIYGNLQLRKRLAVYLNATRGLHITYDQILITRGSQMSMYLAGQLLLKNRIIICGNTNYNTANDTFTYCGGQVKTVSIDKDGLNTQEIETLCKTQPIQAVYVTSHHHYPTTVTLSPQRRMHLLQLAQQYQFAIIEDDYDYDFHYNNAPILPLASSDETGNVLYLGGFTKIIAPALRIGYLIGPVDFIREAAHLRSIIDRQGDTILEHVISILIKNGDVYRHIQKVRKIYKKRRDLFCKLLSEQCGKFFNFTKPEGGMAVWVLLRDTYTWDNVMASAKALDIPFSSDYLIYGDAVTSKGIRMGFACLTTEEIYQSIDRLQKVMNQLKKSSQ
ncbi:PLP-dependent aminotransferase family protein [Aquimarina sp. ERC-38]|uniref:MocR-like pyridoxine biosynthesis transcription factor PdxR n=1 Tax=Aquimarina sp. ERC-38 TaxID=2949996 RepID=UPI002246E424|nr:PLP-dependent aminotransferase family protein [Aquimarina sp. ERC-38]UZO79978.1 PLP-dependent aminotransferase family protein [Aquimarina sp. ERC-38]